MRKAELFKVVWKGWFAGVTVTFVPLLLIAAVVSPEAPNIPWFAPLIVPILAALQGVLVSGIVMLGLAVVSASNAIFSNHTRAS